MTEAPTRPLVLGSGSPRRREILENLRVPFVVQVANADESTLPGEDAATYLARVVLLKLAAVSSVFQVAPVNRPSAILVADTSVIDDGAILGKPASTEENEAMIARLAGRTHEVWTRFVVGGPRVAYGSAFAADPIHAETVVTRVTFRALTPNAIRAYAASGEGTDKAGGYAVQGLGAGVVARIDGSYTNVVGLPACEVLVALERLGLVAT